MEKILSRTIKQLLLPPPPPPHFKKSCSFLPGAFYLTPHGQLDTKEYLILEFSTKKFQFVP